MRYLSYLSVLAGLAIAGITHAEVQSFESGGKTIKVDYYAPAAKTAEKVPAVIVLHGSDGFALGGLWYRSAAKSLAEEGYATYLVHYFNRTGDIRMRDADEIHKKVPVWTQTVRDALTYIEKQPEVNAQRIGIVGVSLGGALAVATAGQDTRVKAVVDYSGFVPKTFTGAMTLPPTLVMHGASDTIVYPANATKLEGMLKAKKVPHEVIIYPDSGHIFKGEARMDADNRAKAFLAEHLK